MAFVMIILKIVEMTMMIEYPPYILIRLFQYPPTYAPKTRYRWNE
jgi:hypothetical protein